MLCIKPEALGMAGKPSVILIQPQPRAWCCQSEDVLCWIRPREVLPCLLPAQMVNRKMQAKEAWTMVSPAEEGLPGRKFLDHEMALFLEGTFSQR